MIDKFREGDIWKNVIVVCKGRCYTWRLHYYLCFFLDPPSPCHNQTTNEHPPHSQTSYVRPLPLQKPISLEEDVQGAIYAARMICRDPDFHVRALGYTFLSGTSWTDRQRAQFEADDNLRHEFNVKSDGEVRDAVTGAIAELPKPIQVKEPGHMIYDIGKMFKSYGFSLSICR